MTLAAAWAPWRARLDGLPPRVRLLGFAVVAALLGALADALVWEPALQVRREAAAASEARAQERAAWALRSAPAPGARPEAAMRAELAAEVNELRRQAAALREALQRTPPAAAGRDAALPAMLAQALPATAGAALVSLSGALPAPTDSMPAQPVVSLRLRGGYAELQRQLAEMARRDGAAPWPAWELDARGDAPQLLLLRQPEGTRP
jgi:hypothetical protein